MSYLAYRISFSKPDLEELEPNGAYFGQIIALGEIRITICYVVFFRFNLSARLLKH